jgi:hypothetical protein
VDHSRILRWHILLENCIINDIVISLAPTAFSDWAATTVAFVIVRDLVVTFAATRRVGVENVSSGFWLLVLAG